MDTSGFYKTLEENLQYQPLFVFDEDVCLTSDQHHMYGLPLKGWYWFDSEEEAKLFFNIE